MAYERIITASDLTAAYSIIIPATSWVDNTCTISNSNLLASGYAYIVSPTASSYSVWTEYAIVASDVTVDGQITFTCDKEPSIDIRVLIIRNKVSSSTAAVITGSISSSDWVDNTASITASGLVASGYVYQISPIATDVTKWSEAGIIASDITVDNTITFTCDTTPTENIGFIILKVGLDYE